MMSAADVLNNERNASVGNTPQTPSNMTDNLGKAEQDFINAKAFLLTASTKSGLNL